LPRLSDYDYDLPHDSIAQTPLEERTASRLLHMDRWTGEVWDKTFLDLENILLPGDLLVLNNTRVTAMRLFGRKSTGGLVELLLLEKIGPSAYACLAKPAKRLTKGAKITFEAGISGEIDLVSEVGKRVVRFDECQNLDDKLREISSIPLPPYIEDTLQDPERYQTVVAKVGGSAAAPTAALHFTRPFLEKLIKKGVLLSEVTLDVGMDTFRPVKSEDLSHHEMHGEKCSVTEDTVTKVSNCAGRVFAVGTTTVRTLETFATGHRRLSAGSTTSRLFVQPGYEFKIVDAILTNFHMPKTTMMVMLAAFCQREFILSSYRAALDSNYRFLSFGDSMLIL
jgi:S-adenosylmethionine:tRNA ribosyltransferase-isomerase